jgi:hypothetical protein
MKTSKKLLIVLASLVIALLIAFLVVLRNDLHTMIDKGAIIKYKAIPVNHFERIEFDGKWDVRIIAGRSCKLELPTDSGNMGNTLIENKNGILHLMLKTNENTKISTMHARITAPLFKKIKAKNGTKIFMQDYTTDSIWFELEDSCFFTGKNNQFKYASFNTEGKSSLQFTQTLN